MNRHNVTNFSAVRMADQIMAEWLDYDNDSAGLYHRLFTQLEALGEKNPHEVIVEAYEIADARWERLFGK